jgi:hypothetical protein
VQARGLVLLIALASPHAVIAGPAASEDGPAITCTKTPAAWSEEHPYGAGAQVSTSRHGVTRVYRCKDGCAVGGSPDDTSNGYWELRGHCGTAPQAAATASGSSRWDATYHLSSKGSTDWRCPLLGWNATLAVVNGKLSVPWQLEYADRHGNSTATAPVGQIDGVVHDDGSVAIATTITATQLPREVASGARRQRPTIDALRAAAPAMTFTAEESRRRAELVLDMKCSMTLYAWGDGIHELRPGEAEDNVFPQYGKHVPDDEFHQLSDYESGKSYPHGAIVRESYSSNPHNLMYRCVQKSCDDAPGSSSWVDYGWW